MKIEAVALTWNIVNILSKTVISFSPEITCNLNTLSNHSKDVMLSEIYTLV